MKKTILTVLVVVAFVLNSNAQHPNILIGLDNPSYGVKIKANWPGYNGGWARGFHIVNEDNSNKYFMIGANGNSTNGVTRLNYGFIGKDYLNRYMVFRPTGNIGIGTDNPDAKLAVKGKIHAEEVKIDLNVPADYVFQKYYLGTSALKADYVMPTLEEVEVYTKANYHLPEVPSARQLQENGLQVGEMTNMLLQKIEELTLYTIEQQKAIKALQAEVAQLKIKTN